jgi:hypothetical protein
MEKKYENYTLEQLLESALVNIENLPTDPSFKATKSNKWLITQVRIYGGEQIKAALEKIRAQS